MAAEQIDYQGETEPRTGKPGTWPKGVSGNPRGRPKRGETYLDRLEALASSKSERLAAAIIRKALDGDVRAHAYLRDTLYGVPKQTLEVQSEDSPMDRLAQMLMSERDSGGNLTVVEAESYRVVESLAPPGPPIETQSNPGLSEAEPT